MWDTVSFTGTKRYITAFTSKMFVCLFVCLCIVAFTASFNNMQTLKFKTQLKILLLAAVNHYYHDNQGVLN